MRGQAAVETMLIIGAILTVVSALMLVGQRSNEADSAMSAARTGANEAIAQLNMQYGCQISVDELTFNDGMISLSLTASNGGPSDSVIRDGVRTEVLKYVYQAVNGVFPDNVQPVRTRNYIYDVSVAINRVSR
jgi:uncharacterized protein (UPF0333 family)